MKNLYLSHSKLILFYTASQSYSSLGPQSLVHSWVHCCCSVTQSCPALCNCTDCSTPGFPVLHLSPRVCSNSCLLSQWCHPTISSSVTPFYSCLQPFPASGSFLTSSFLTSTAEYSLCTAKYIVNPNKYLMNEWKKEMNAQVSEQAQEPLEAEVYSCVESR